MLSPTTLTKYDNYLTYIASTSRNDFQLARIGTNTSVSTNATAPNLPGPGRTVGLLFDRLGAQVEKILNICADRRGLGPKAVALEIRCLCRHDETTIVERHAGFVHQFTDKAEKALRRLCKRLLKYARLVSRILAIMTSDVVEGTGSCLLNFRLWKIS